MKKCDLKQVYFHGKPHCSNCELC